VKKVILTALLLAIILFLILRSNTKIRLGTPTIYDDIAYIGTNTGLMLAYDTKTQNELWRFQADGLFMRYISLQPLIHNGRVYFGGESLTAITVIAALTLLSFPVSLS